MTTPNTEQRNDAVRLKPCPFCGSADHLTVSKCGSLTGDMPDRPYRVVCDHIDHDQVQGPVDYGYFAAIDAWNTRAQPPASSPQEEIATIGSHIGNGGMFDPASAAEGEVREIISDLIQIIEGERRGDIMLTVEKARALLSTEAGSGEAKDKRIVAIRDEARRANNVIRLNRHREGQGMITVATAMHRIEQWAAAIAEAGKPTPSEPVANEADSAQAHYEAAARMASRYRQENERLKKALEPFALASIEGVVKEATGYTTITTCAEYFHRASAALAEPASPLPVGEQGAVDGALMREAADEIVSLKQRLESAEKTMREVALEAHETIPPDGKEAAFVALHSIGKMVSGYFSALQEQEKQNG